MEKRTVIRFESLQNVWPAITGWAEVKGFKLKESTANEWTYRKGTGMLVAPSMLKIRQDNQFFTMEAWLRINFFTRLMSLFILPSEIGIRSGGAKAVIPRNKYRKDMNELLATLSLPPIC